MMRIFTFIFASTAILLSLIAPPPAHSATLEGGYFACITKQSWDELNEHISRNDRRGADYLVQKGLCLVTKAGIEVSVLSSWWGTAKVRAYVGDQSIILWTNSENVKS